ncbi:glycerophosphodiester phosphodiesterase family protein [Vibrio ostreicida]|uniref:Glycerophosphodiester phosphodiesterase family protein n=1 Tax=Vibrio ostreicida TaxID=526588 RepID=A0ABT8BUW9_9VIBR|nr:glycerophosphodiester phosphodiesterase family protein [Vibrio ostreicida]MDN3609880.1 glycerophosphodiester phosphodiesterase family protein [Vibrio ostreicida]NPD10000.1 glycerophosphoryl diester phosphodiesterase [Vibrio ostreicida]
MMIIGHRGVAAYYPENTRSSVQAAADLGLEWVEVDVQPTKDNILVVCHDYTIDRCSNGHGRIDQLTLDDLRQFDFGDWFDKRFRGEKIMTLSELLLLSRQLGIKLNIEIKVDHQDTLNVASLVKQTLESDLTAPDTIILSSFDHDIMRHLHLRLPDYRLAVLTESLSSNDIQLLEDISAFSCNLHYQRVNQEQISQLQSSGYQVWCYTVNQPESIRCLTNIDAIFSDDPARFL